MKCSVKRTGKVDEVVCVVCPNAKCPHYREYYESNRESMELMIAEYVGKYPHKYKVEVIMTAEKTKYLIVINKENKVECIKSLEEIQTDVGRYAGMKILEISGEYRVVQKIIKMKYEPEKDVPAAKNNSNTQKSGSRKGRSKG